MLNICENEQDVKLEEKMKRAMLVTLITSFYLNLARNDDNREFLLKLNLFKRLNMLM